MACGSLRRISNIDAVRGSLFVCGVPLRIRASDGAANTTNLESPHTVLQRVRLILPALAALFIPLALVLYFTALHTLFGNSFIFIRTQAQASAGFSTLGIALKTLVAQPHFSLIVVHTLLELTTFLLFLLLMILCFYGPERLAKGQWTFAVFGVLLLFSALLFSGSASTR